MQNETFIIDQNITFWKNGISQATKLVNKDYAQGHILKAIIEVTIL